MRVVHLLHGAADGDDACAQCRIRFDLGLGDLEFGVDIEAVELGVEIILFDGFANLVKNRNGVGGVVIVGASAVRCRAVKSARLATTGTIADRVTSRGSRCGTEPPALK
jgi:hypothetical protein